MNSLVTKSVIRAVLLILLQGLVFRRIAFQMGDFAFIHLFIYPIIILLFDSYAWNGQTYTSSSQYTWLGVNSNGCDSIATLNLTINSSTSSTTDVTACDSYDWNGQTYTSSSQYTWLGVNFNGCDSIAVLNLTINNSVSTSNTLSICSGDSILVGNNTYNTGGNYTDVLTTINGCDSTVTTILSIDPLGCTDPTQFNYDPNAICDDGSCQPFTYGCTDPSADNYNSL